MNLEKLLSELEAKSRAAPSGKWRWDSGNVQVEREVDRLAIANVATTNDLSGEDYGKCLPWHWDQVGEFIATCNPSTIERLISIIRRQQSVLEEWKDSGEPDFKDALADVERIAGGV